MKKLSLALMAATFAISAVAVPGGARAENGQVAAGVAGGLVGGGCSCSASLLLRTRSDICRTSPGLC